MPNSLIEILETLVKNFASLEQDSDGSYWWGHDTNLGNQSEAFDQAIAAITALVPEKQEQQYKFGQTLPFDKTYARGFNDAVDTIHRNFTGQTDNERKQ